jgi:hypothetical protein
MSWDINEERTCKETIGPQLEQAGWCLRDHPGGRSKIPWTGTTPSRGSGWWMTRIREQGEVYVPGVVEGPAAVYPRRNAIAYPAV